MIYFLIFVSNKIHNKCIEKLLYYIQYSGFQKPSKTLGFI